MQKNIRISRRHFLQSSSTVTAATLLKVGAPSLLAITQAACSAKLEGAAYALLGADEAADFAAISARIIPTTDTPGANEAGVVYFFDRALAAEMSFALEPMRAGLADLNDSVSDAYPGSSRFSRLDDEAQDALLTKIENGGFFNLIWLMTMFGFFGMSKYGGNKDHLSWDLIGFEGNQGAWSYPFGYYDAEYAKEQSHDE